MEVNRTYIVKVKGHYQLLFSTTLEWFVTTNGAFGQRDMSLEKITDEEAWELREPKKLKNNKQP